MLNNEIPEVFQDFLSIFRENLITLNKAAFHVGRSKYVPRELENYVGVRIKIPMSQKILWIVEFLTVLAYR